MSLRIAINGFGRIGRLVFRVLSDCKDLEVVAINDMIQPDYMAYLLCYDSIHGQFLGDVSFTDNSLIVDGKSILVSSYARPELANWQEQKIDLVIESTGLFTQYQQASGHLQAGAKKVIISAPSSDVPMIVMGVNHLDYNPQQKIVSNASCTTNCLGPIAKILHQHWGNRRGVDYHSSCGHGEPKNSGWCIGRRLAWRSDGRGQYYSC
jgi:glyceraldehyde 3-phosphate dehydrogenase